MQQGLDNAEILEVPFAFSSNGDGFLLHDRTGQHTPIEQELALDAFPSPDELWQRYCAWKGIASAKDRETVETPYYDDGSGKSPRYYQINAINRTVEAIARGQQRILLVMATGVKSESLPKDSEVLSVKTQDNTDTIKTVMFVKTSETDSRVVVTVTNKNTN